MCVLIRPLVSMATLILSMHTVTSLAIPVASPNEKRATCSLGFNDFSCVTDDESIDATFSSNKAGCHELPYAMTALWIEAACKTSAVTFIKVWSGTGCTTDGIWGSQSYSTSNDTGCQNPDFWFGSVQLMT